jgi:2-phosphosulfolactate phosphatase
LELELYFSGHALNREVTAGWTVIVVDVLRSSATISRALHNGAKAVVPAESVSVAVETVSRLDRSAVLLCGERGGEKIGGFDLGNSPSEYDGGAVKGKTLIMTTTNGTASILRCVGAKELLVGSFVNFSAVTDYLSGGRDKIAVVCCGEESRFCLEDSLCGGLFVERLEQMLGDDLVLEEGAAAAKRLARDHAHDILGAVRSSRHGRYLDSIGFAEDVTFCATLDSVPVVPALRQGKLVLAEQP